jgi:hypothetical protein
MFVDIHGYLLGAFKVLSKYYLGERKVRFSVILVLWFVMLKGPE